MTGSDLDKVLIELNRILAEMDSRIKKLEEAPKPPSPAKTVTKKVVPKKVVKKT